MGAIVIAHHPMRYAIKYFPELFERMLELANIKTIMLGKYNAEYVHELIRGEGAMSVIPIRGNNVPIWRISSYSRQIKRNFLEMYGEKQDRDAILRDQED